MPLGDINKLIDQALLDRRGMTSADIEQKTRDNAYQNNQIEQNLKTWTKPEDFLPFTPKADVPGSVGSQLNAKYLPSMQLEDSLSKILATGSKQNARNEIANEEIKSFDLFGPKASGKVTEKMDQLKNFLEKDLTNSPEIIQAALTLKDKLSQGDLNSLKELKGILQNVGEEDLKDLQDAYTDVEEFTTQTNKFNTAKRQVEGHLNNITSPEDRQSFLNSVRKNKQQLSFSILDPKTSPEDLNNQLLDNESFKIGSPVYNEDRLKEFKINQDYGFRKSLKEKPLTAYEEFDAQKNLSYNYALFAAVKDKKDSIQKQSIALDEKIKATVDPEVKDQLITQKAKLNQDDAYLTTLSKELESYTSPDKYLKEFYPLAYEKQRKNDHREVVQGANIAKTGDSEDYLGYLGKAKFHTYRAGQLVLKNAASGLAGLRDLLGSSSDAVRYDLASRNFTPPSYRQGVDLNNNDKLDQLEVTRGKDGEPVYYTDAVYTNAKGKSVWNMWSMIEQSAPIAHDIATTVLLTRGLGGIARGANLTYANIGKALGLESALVKAAPRISTFGSVFTTTFPRIYAEEVNNFKNSSDARNVALLRAGVEAISETFVPQTEMFKAGRSFGPLDPLFDKVASKLPFGLDVLSKKADVVLGLLPENAISKTKAALAVLPAQLRKVASEAVQEGFIEEEFSLIGNYFVDKYAVGKNFEVEKANELTLDNFIETGLSGFVSSLLISGGSELASGNIKRERLNQARWDMANNPNTYKDLITKQVQNKTLTPQQGYERMALVDSLNSRLEGMKEISNLKDLTTLLDDKDAQRDYFTKALQQEDLLKVDRLALNEEQQKEYDSLLARNAKDLEIAKQNIEKYTNLTDIQKQEIIAKVFDKQAQVLESPEATLAESLNAGYYAQNQLKTFSKTDKNFEFIESQYKEYQKRVEANIADRIDTFQTLLENNPEQITTLELQLAQNSLIPFLQNYNNSKAPFVSEETVGPKNYDELDLLEKIKLELELRKQLSEEDFVSQATQDLKNPETKAVQARQMAIAELSSEEFESGQLSQDASKRLTPLQALFLADALAVHKQQKEENPNQESDLEQYFNSIVANNYELSTKGLTPQEALNKRKEINQKIKESVKSNPKTPEVTNASSPITPVIENKEPKEEILEKGNQTKNKKSTDYVQPTADVETVLEFLGLDPTNAIPLNVEYFSQVNSDLSLIEEIEEPEDRAAEKIALFERILVQSNPIDIYSGLVGMYPSKASELQDFFATYEDSPNTSLVNTFLTSLQVNQLQEVLNEKLKKEEVVPTEEELKSSLELEEAPTEVVFEDEVVDGIIREQELLENIQEAPVTPRDFSLNIVSLDVNNVPLTDDARTAFAVNVVNAFDNQRGKLPPVKLRIQGAMETYRYVLSSAKFEALKELKNKPTLTSEDAATLRSILSLNGVPFHENSFIQFLIDNPSKIGTGILSVLTDKEGKVMLFEKNGVISAVGTPLIATFKAQSLKGSLKTLVDIIKANPETVATADITGTIPGTDLVPIQLSSVKNKPNYSLRVFTEPTADASGKYTLYPGRTYVINSNNFFKSATAVSLPKADGELVYKLVEAFNNGTLPKGLPESTVEFLDYLRTYQLTSFNSEKAVYVLDKNKTGDKIVFKKKNKSGKWQTAANLTDKVKSDIIASFSDAYKNIVADKLNSNEKYYPAKLNSKGEIEILPVTNYRDHVMSKEFGATFREEGNRTLGFDNLQINAPSSADVTVNEALENLPESTTPITESENIPTPVPTVQETPQETKTEEQPKTRRKRSLEDLNANTQQLNRARVLGNRVNAKQRAKAKAWVENHPIFKNTSFIFDQTINHPEAYAVWSKAGIQLFNGANYAEAYHEAWHEFTQLYLTPEQKESLYKEAAAIYGNLTPFELEEKMAEDFRSFALTNGKTMPEVIQKSKQAKGIFQSIWDFITNLFSDKKTLDFYFKQLYKGNISTYKRSEDNIRFKELFSKKLSLVSDENLVTYSFVDSDKIVKQFDALFTYVANQLYKDVDGSFINVAVSKQAIPLVYKGIKNIMTETYNELVDLEEAGDQSVNSKLDYLDNLFNNFETVVQFHIQNSLIFDDKVKKAIQLEALEEEQDAQGELGSFEKSINETSQKELASNLIISAIRTLPKHTKGNLEPQTDYLFGVPELGDFDTNWNILRRSLAGLTTYEQMYNKLKELSKEYPQFNTLISYLPNAVTRYSSLSFKNEFFNLFTMPYMEGYTTKINKDEKGNVTEVKVNKSSSLDAVRLKNLYDGEFGMTQGLYKVFNPNTGVQELDVDAYFSANSSLPAGLDVLATDEEKRARISQLINLIRPLGFNLSQAAVESIPLEDMSTVEKNINFIRTKLRSLGDNGTVGNPLNQLSSPHKVDKQVIKSENFAVNYFLNLEVKANPEYIDDMRMNAEGSRIWSVNQHTFMSRVANALNDYETYPTAQSIYEEFPQLNPEYNSNTIGSFVLDYLFDSQGNRITDDLSGKKVYRKVELANLEGIKIEEEGEKTINTNYIDKHFAEVNSFLQQGVEEINRLSGKSTTRAFVLDLGMRKFLGMDKEWSKDSAGNIRLFEPQMRLLFKAIMAEIKMTKEIEDKIANGQKIYKHPKVNIRDSEGNPKLAFFENILSSQQRKNLYNLFENTQVTDEEGNNNLDKLFDLATQEFPIIVEIAQNFNEYFANQARESIKLFKSKNLDTVAPINLFKYHFFSFLSRLEQHKIFYGHPYYYKGPKDIEKRLSAWNAFGTYTMLDSANAAFLQNKVFTQRGSFINYAQENNIPINEPINDLSKINYIVLKDNPVVSKTALANKEAYGESLNAYINEGDKKGDSKTQDAAAFMTVDLFKRFYALSTGVTPEMEKEIERQNRIYQAILDNDQVTLNKELNTKPFYKFTIKKLQYAGFAKGKNNEGIPVFHKYSVKPILPSEAASNPELLAILHKLHASSADYAVFESGTKISETVEPVSLFTKDGKINTTNVPIGQIDIKHLKEQVLVENKESFETVFSTQFRSLLYKDAKDEEVLKLYEAYKSYVKEIVEYDKINYLENLQDKDKLVNFLLKELEKKNASEATKDLIKVKNDGALMYMLDSMVDRTVMESAIVSSAKRKIIRQKLNGAQRVQYPVSIVRPGRTLNYYSLTKDGKEITQAEVIVSFSKGYYPLLNLVYEGSPLGELNSNGEPINPFDALTRLNEALKNPAFVKANKKALSMVAIRIPGQGYNSMENFTVVEFLPEESGEIILVPDEMVVKSGSDYDIDKLFCYDPYIAQDGSVPVTNQTAQQLFDRKKELEEEYKGYTTAINQTKEYKNGLVAKLEEILTKNGLDKNKKLGEVYKELKELKSTNSSEVNEEAISIEDLRRLQEAFKTGTTAPVVERSQELIDRIKTLSNVLSESFDQKISQELREVVDTLKGLYSDKQRVKNEIEGLRKTLANNLVFNIVDRLSQSDIFESLVTPNSSDIIKDLAARFGTKEDNTEATYTSILSPIYQMYVFNLNTYKKSLGVGAKMNTFHSLIQKTTLTLENESANRFYMLPSNKVDGKVTYSQINDTERKPISLLNGQMISAHVDIEKEDEVARIYFNNTITPVVLYCSIAGTPIEMTTRLINQKYEVDGKLRRSSIVRYGLGTSAETILEEMLKDPNIAKIIKVGKKGISIKKTIDHALNLATKNASKEANTEYMLNDTSRYADFLRFMQFLEFENQQKQLSTLSLNTDYHTFSPQNFESFRRGGEDLRQLRKENYFSRAAVDYIISETEIAPFQIQADILDKFVEVMPISANRKLTDIILTLHAASKKKGSKTDYEKFSRTFKNDLLYALFINRVPEAQDYVKYLVKTNEDNIVNMHSSLLAKLEKRGIESDNVIFDMFKQNTSNESSYIRTGLLLSSVDYSINVYKEAFENGLSWTSPELNPESEEDTQLIEDMQKFFKVFAYAGILGTQLNKKIDSYLPLIPESIYTYAMSEIVNDFKNELDTVSASLLEEVRNTISTKEEDEDLEEGVVTKLLSESNFLSKFINRFQAVHPEFNKIFKDVNPDLAFFKDYRLDQENSTPTKRRVVEENVPAQTTVTQEELPTTTTGPVTDIVADPFKSVEEINREQENNCKIPKI